MKIRMFDLQQNHLSCCLNCQNFEVSREKIKGSVIEHLQAYNFIGQKPLGENVQVKDVSKVRNS